MIMLSITKVRYENSGMGLQSPPPEHPTSSNVSKHNTNLKQTKLFSKNAQ